MPQQEKASLLRDIPSIDALLALEPFVSVARSHGHATAVRIARQAVDRMREDLLSGLPINDHDAHVRVLTGSANVALAVETARRINRVINATGVVIHTNLGRSVLSDAAIQAIQRSSDYCTLEYDLLSGSRGRRGSGAEALICELTGAEAALIVNNCAAATFLVLRALAKGRDVLISRGELVEIGGDFRIPDVLAESGAILREVGTTNRTKLSDYEKALTENAGLILRVHPSNYRVVGFTESPSNRDLAELARDRNIPFFEDAGSGAIVDFSQFGLDEPVIANSIADGVDVVAFSGDKLLGGVQAGFVVGRRDLIESIRRHPLYRALRVDKLSYAAIEATLTAYAREKHFEEIPTLRMIAAEAETILTRAKPLIEGLAEAVRCEILEGESVIGGGAAPTARRKTWLISVSADARSADEIDSYFRSRSVPIIGRIADGRYLLDLRTVRPSEESDLRIALDELSRHEF